MQQELEQVRQTVTQPESNSGRREKSTKRGNTHKEENPRTKINTDESIKKEYSPREERSQSETHVDIMCTRYLIQARCICSKKDNESRLVDLWTERERGLDLWTESSRGTWKLKLKPKGLLFLTATFVCKASSSMLCVWRAPAATHRASRVASNVRDHSARWQAR